jgi:hypothetical protein
MRRALFMIVLLGACETPPMSLRFKLTDSDSQKCISADNGMEATSCADITMECDAALSVRIVPPATPEFPYVSVCQKLTGGQRKLCSIAGVDLPQPKEPIPEQVLEVQMAVFPMSEITTDADGNLVCPIVQFGADGLPVTSVSCSDQASCPRPAVGGRAFYHPGDEETVVELGCTELELLNGEQCKGINRTEVIAAVNEFDSSTGVEKFTADRLTVSIGEPLLDQAMHYVLDIGQIHPLARTTAVSPTWSSEFTDLGLIASYCIEVLEDAPMATRTLTCHETTPAPARIDAVGYRLKPEMLATILKAMTTPVFPPQGLVVGIVLNQSFKPVSGATVMPNCPAGMTGCMINVKYLSEDQLSIVGDGTHSSGIFISTDAPYRSTFSRTGTPAVFGGRVDNKVTIVVLQEPGIGTGG